MVCEVPTHPASPATRVQHIAGPGFEQRDEVANRRQIDRRLRFGPWEMRRVILSHSVVRRPDLCSDAVVGYPLSIQSSESLTEDERAVSGAGSCNGAPGPVATTAFGYSESIAAATSPVAASGIAVAASSITSSRASGISRVHASPLPTGKNGSRLP